MEIEFRKLMGNEESIDNFMESIVKNGLPSFMEYGVAKGFIEADEIKTYVCYFIGILIDFEKYEDCGILKQQFEFHYNDILNDI